MDATGMELQRGQRHLRRLEVLTDVVYGLLIWAIVTALPEPPEEGSELSLDYLLDTQIDVVSIIVGMVIVLNYWAQNNALTGNLRATNTLHASLSILQLVCLLLYVYAIGLSAAFPGDTGGLALQSLLLVLAGAFGVAAWVYATRQPAQFPGQRTHVGQAQGQQCSQRLG